MNPTARGAAAALELMEFCRFVEALDGDPSAVFGELRRRLGSAGLLPPGSPCRLAASRLWDCR